MGTRDSQPTHIVVVDGAGLQGADAHTAKQASGHDGLAGGVCSRHHQAAAHLQSVPHKNITIQLLFPPLSS